MITDIARRSDEPIEAVTPLTLRIAAAGAVLAVAGAVALATNRNRDLGLLSVAACVLMVSVLALSIFGVLVLPVIVLTIVILGRRASGRRGVARALAAGPAVAVGVAALLVIWVQPPLVECHENGVSSTGRPWWNTSSGSGTSSISDVATSSGTIETPSGTYAYRCEGDTLVEFRRTQ